MEPRILAMIATVMETCAAAKKPRRGRPPARAVRVLASLRRFLREGAPWRGLKATSAETSGSTLRRRLANWAAINLLQRVHAVLVAMLRGDPDLILDSCSVRAKRGGDLIGPNPTDRGKQGSKYHVAVTGDGVPVACAVTGANVNDTVLFGRLFLMAFAVVAKIRTVFADKGYDAEANRELCRAFGAEPHLHKRGRPHARLRAGQAALAGRAQQRLAAREQAPGAAL